MQIVLGGSQIYSGSEYSISGLVSVASFQVLVRFSLITSLQCFYVYSVHLSNSIFDEDPEFAADILKEAR